MKGTIIRKTSKCSWWGVVEVQLVKSIQNKMDRLKLCRKVATEELTLPSLDISLPYCQALLEGKTSSSIYKCVISLETATTPLMESLKQRRHFKTLQCKDVHLWGPVAVSACIIRRAKRRVQARETPWETHHPYYQVTTGHMQPPKQSLSGLRSPHLETSIKSAWKSWRNTSDTLTSCRRVALGDR